MHNHTTTKQAVILSPTGVARFLLISIFLLLVGHLAAFVEDYIRHVPTKTAWYIIHYFDFNLENNVPTWFSVIILAFAALLLLVIYLHQKGNHIKGAYYWLALAFIFVFLSIDESVQIHEALAEILRPGLGKNASGFFYWAWVIPYGVFVIAVLLFFIRFVLSLPKRTRNLFFIAAFLFVTGALGLEFIEGYFFKIYGLNHIYNRILYCAEELLEMGGVTLFIYSLLGYMEENGMGIYISSAKQRVQ